MCVINVQHFILLGEYTTNGSNYVLREKYCTNFVYCSNTSLPFIVEIIYLQVSFTGEDSNFYLDSTIDTNKSVLLQQERDGFLHYTSLYVLSVVPTLLFSKQLISSFID